MIVRNEEEVLGRCLSSVTDFIDEIIIVDTGSTDRTKEVARKYTDKIFDFEWVDDFSKARNFSFSKATKDYIMWLDADDIVPEESRLQILELKRSQILAHNMECIMMDYQYRFDAQGILISTLLRERIIKRKCNFKWIGLVHEILDVSGKAFITNIKIKHLKKKTHSDQYIKIFEKAVEQGKKLSLRDKLHYGNECFKHKQYQKAVDLYEEISNEKSLNHNQRIYAYLKLADCHIQYNEFDHAIANCLKTFELDPPRGEACCKLGHIYALNQQIHKAIGWYKTASHIDIPVNSAYIKTPCYTWLPHVHLCTCYMSLGLYAEAKQHNDIASKYIPDSSYVKDNERLLMELASHPVIKPLSKG
ncbi:glycosyltransferase [Chengkuizengella sediminis]|nr:glycosyltransferase [Chengkuizengella sediminis]